MRLHEYGALGDLGYAIVEHRMGFLCGYLAIPPGHPWSGRDYCLIDVEVHGDLSYSDWTRETVDDGPYPAPLPGNLWWIGFDCAHFLDWYPGCLLPPDWAGEAVYRDRDFVFAELEHLATQVIAAMGERKRGRS